MLLDIIGTMKDTVLLFTCSKRVVISNAAFDCQYQTTLKQALTVAILIPNPSGKL